MTLATDFEAKEIKFFTPEEFACKCGQCGGRNLIDPSFVSMLDQFREFLGVPMVASSGYRCPLHPIEARKSAPGPHSTGLAVDILFHGEATHRLLYSLGEFKAETGITFKGIGLNQRGDIENRFVHLDMCVRTPNRPRPHVWTY